MKDSLKWSLLTATLLAYGARTWSCSFVLGRFSQWDDVPYARFDHHGIGAVYGILGGLVFAGPIIWLAVKLLFPPAPASLPDGANEPRRRHSATIALAIAVPSFTQLDYMIALPLSVMWPVATSALLWFGLVVAIWILAINKHTIRRLSQRVRYVAIIVAVFITLPKLMLLTEHV